MPEPNSASDGGIHAAPPRGYTVVLPPGWARIPLREGTDVAVQKIADDAVTRLPGDFPRDKASRVRMELIKRLRKAAREARDNAGLDLYLPVEETGGVTVAASFVVAEVAFGSVVEVDPSLVAATLIAESDDSAPVTVDGALGVRAERLVKADPERDVEYASRRVDYVLSVPEDAERWVTVGFSTIGDGEPEGEFADLLVELFDAVMTTFRWRRA